MEHSIKLGDCLGKGAFGSVYRVRFDLFSETCANLFLVGVESCDGTDFGGKTDSFIQYTQIRSQSHHGPFPTREMLMIDGN